jgi:hypothetical protein
MVHPYMYIGNARSADITKEAAKPAAPPAHQGEDGASVHERLVLLLEQVQLVEQLPPVEVDVSVVLSETIHLGDQAAPDAQTTKQQSNYGHVK